MNAKEAETRKKDVKMRRQKTIRTACRALFTNGGSQLKPILLVPRILC